MSHCNRVNVTISNSELDKLKLATKNETGVTLRLTSSIINKSNYETSFPHKLLPTNREIPKFRRDFTNNLSTGIKLSETQLST